MKNTTFILCCLFCAALLQNIGAQSLFLNAEIDKLLSEQYKADGTGAAALVARQGQIVYQKAFGMADLERNVRMRPDMVFRIGSITKQFTAVAILQLMEQGKLSLQDSITRFLPDYPMQGHKITIEHLLTHTSGIKSYTDMEDFDSNLRKDMKPEAVIAFFKDQPMDFAPGTQWRYNNSGYFLLGYIIEKISGKTYAQYLEDAFFKPLGMTNSCYGNDAKIIKNRAGAYQKGENGVENADYLSMTLPYAAGSIQSTVNDLFLWHKAVHAYKLIKKETLDKALTPYKLANGRVTDYGYGWFLSDVKGSLSIEHSGGINGFLTMEKYLPKEDVFVAVFSNCTCNPPAAVANKIAALAAGKIFARAPIREINLEGAGYARGLQHGQQLKKEIGEVVAKWKKSVESQSDKPADQIVKEFFEYARFDEAIKKWTPELYEEVRGIADGSGQAFNDIMVHNLLDEFWVWQDAREQHHCSGIGVPARDGNPGYIAQNMDLEGYTDGYQTLLRLAKTDKTPEQLILTYPGLIALNGLNEAGIGACMNTLMQLKGNATGLPVAFVVRRILNSTDKDEVLNFIQTVPHASGQNYIIGIKGEVYDFEASCNKVVRFDPKNANGAVYHTNHPVANDDLKDWYKEPEKGNSAIRFASVQGRMAGLGSIKDVDIKAALRAKDDPGNPVCRAFNHRGGTFGSVVMTLTGNPKLQITAGPPDESEYKEVRFSTGKTLPGEEGWRTITGYLMDENNEEYVGGGIHNMDFNIYTLGGAPGSGGYRLQVPHNCKALTFSYDGCDRKTIPLTVSDTLNVVILGYGGHGITPKMPDLSHRVKRSQPTIVTGHITSGNGTMAIRPRVRIESTETVVYTDKDGHYALTVPAQYDILSFESDNLPARKVLLGDFKTMNVSVSLWPLPQKEQSKKRGKKRRSN